MRMLDQSAGVRRFLAVAALAVGVATTSPAVAGGKFVFANSSAYDTLDPHAIFDVGRVASRINLYDGRGLPRVSRCPTTG